MTSATVPGSRDLGFDGDDVSHDEPCMFLEDFTSRTADPCVLIFVEVFRRRGTTGCTTSSALPNIRERNEVAPFPAATSCSAKDQRRSGVAVGDCDTSSAIAVHDTDDGNGSSSTPWKLFLQLIAEPISRPSHVHQYRMTRYSLGAAVANGWSAEEVVAELFRFAYEPRGSEQGLRIEAFIFASIARYDRAAIVAEGGRLFLRVRDASLWAALQQDAQIRSLCVAVTAATCPSRVAVTSAAVTAATAVDVDQNEATWVDASAEKAVVAQPAHEEVTFQWELLDHSAGRSAAEILFVRYALPIYRTYHFWHDDDLRSIHMTLRPQCKPRPYQVEAVEAALTDSGSAVRSGVIILPCGAGKTLVGVLLASVVKKPTLIVCAGSVSVEQWRHQLLEWADLQPLPPPVDPQKQRRDEAASSRTADGSSTGYDEAAVRELARAPPRRGGGGRGAARSNSSTGMRMPTAVSHGQLVGAARVSCLTGKQKDEITDETDVVITTYTMLGVAYDHLRRRSRVGVAADSHARRDDDDGELSHRAAAVNSSHNSGATLGPNRDRRASAQSGKKRNPKEVLFERTWGLMLLDEVHMAPAAVFRESIGNVPCRAVVGLTATFVREDHRMADVLHVVGPKLFDVSWEHLCRLGYLASVVCVEVHVPMTQDFMREYTSRVRIVARGASDTSTVEKDKDAVVVASHNGGTAAVSTSHDRPAPSSSSSATLCFTPVLPLIAAANPYKFLCVWELVQRHAAQRAKILLFCDHILLLRQYAEVFHAPLICGETSHKERLAVFSEFQTTQHLNLVCISRVGDVSVNLPNANVVIQVSSHGGSRRQEAQRLGRILRPKALSRKGPATVSSSSSSAFHTDAYFYSIVSRDTLEVAYASSRSQFLLDQGYTCRLLSFDAPEKESDLCAYEEEQVKEKPQTAWKPELGPEPATVAKIEAVEGSIHTPHAPHVARDSVSGGKSSTHVLGDAAGIKEEAMLGEVVRSGNRLSTMMIRAATSTTTAPPNSGATISLNTVRSKAWQLRLLASMIARWELEYRSSATAKRAQRVAGEKARRSDTESSEELDNDDEMDDSAKDDGSDLSRSRAGVCRPARAIKRELLDADVVEQVAPPMQQPQQHALWQLTTLGDGVVYHELLAE